MAKQTFSVGDRVQLTSKFLRSTGQYTGREAASVWTVTGHSGSWLITDEPLETSYVNSAFTAEELTSDPSLKFRRIAPSNVQKTRK